MFFFPLVVATTASLIHNMSLAPDHSFVSNEGPSAPIAGDVFKVGNRVERGPNWPVESWEGNMGTIMTMNSESKTTMSVKWDFRGSELWEYNPDRLQRAVQIPIPREEPPEAGEEKDIFTGTLPNHLSEGDNYLMVVAEVNRVEFERFRSRCAEIGGNAAAPMYTDPSVFKPFHLSVNTGGFKSMNPWEDVKEISKRFNEVMEEFKKKKLPRDKRTVSFSKIDTFTRRDGKEVWKTKPEGEGVSLVTEMNKAIIKEIGKIDGIVGTNRDGTVFAEDPFNPHVSIYNWGTLDKKFDTKPQPQLKNHPRCKFEDGEEIKQVFDTIQLVSARNTGMSNGPKLGHKFYYHVLASVQV